MGVFTIGPGREFATLNAATAARFPLTESDTWICYGGANLVSGQVTMHTWNDFDVTIMAAPGHQYTWGEFSTEKAHIRDEGNSWSFNGIIEPINQGTGILYFQGIQTWNTYNATGNAVFKPYDNGYDVGVNIIADNCYFRGIRGEGPQDTARRHRVVALGNVERDSRIILRNCVCDGFQSDYVEVFNRGGGVLGFVNGPGTPVVWTLHCTFVNGDWGVTTYSDEVVVKSCLAADNRQGGFEGHQDGIAPGTWTDGCDYNISDDAAVPTGTGNLASQTVNFIDAANSDYRPADSGLNLGVDLSAFTYPVTTDLLGNPRTVWTAGAYEYTASPQIEPTGLAVTNYNDIQ